MKFHHEKAFFSALNCYQRMRKHFESNFKNLSAIAQRLSFDECIRICVCVLCVIFMIKCCTFIFMVM